MGRRPLCPRHLTSVRLDQATAAFVNYWVSNPTYAASTVSTKETIANALVLHLGPEKEVWTLTCGDFDDVMEFIMKGASPEEIAQRPAGRKVRTGRKSFRSISQARTVLRQFADYCHRHRWLSREETLQKPLGTSSKDNAGAKKDYVRIPSKQWTDILELADTIHPRLRMSVALGLFCGRRVSESTALQWKDIDWDNERINFYNQKNHRWLVIPLFPAIREEFERWKRWTTAAGHGNPQPNWYLVPSRIDSRYITGFNSRLKLKQEPWKFPVDMTRRAGSKTIWSDTRKLLNKLEFGAGEGTHTWRRSAAKSIAKDYDLRAAQALLGHVHITTTQLYTGNEEGYELLQAALMPKKDPDGPDTPNTEAKPNPELPDNVIPLRRLA